MRNATNRTADLRQMLIARRHESQTQVLARIRESRTDGSRQAGDDLDRSDAHMQGDMELTLLQMRAETLKRVDDALVRLDAGTYGSCVDCDREIDERRLRALPFALRCQPCESRREQLQAHSQRLALRRGRMTLFSDASGY
jgi:DnaK suppressor protein